MKRTVFLSIGFLALALLVFISVARIQPVNAFSAENFDADTKLSQAQQAGELDHLRYVVFGGEALDPPRLRPWLTRYGDEQPQLINMYGITETTVHVTYRRIRTTDVGKPSSVIEYSNFTFEIPNHSMYARLA